MNFVTIKILENFLDSLLIGNLRNLSKINKKDSNVSISLKLFYIFSILKLFGIEYFQIVNFKTKKE